MFSIRVCTLEGKEVTFGEIVTSTSKQVVFVDFWHTKCVRCPAALSKLNSLVESYDSVLFVACALSQGPGIQLKYETLVLT
jgi:thiol-disulfide isomerase/thioredoxin